MPIRATSTHIDHVTGHITNQQQPQLHPPQPSNLVNVTSMGIPTGLAVGTGTGTDILTH